jgi:hypothetical protein
MVVCQFHHLRTLTTDLLSLIYNYNFKLLQFSVYALLYVLFATYRSRSSSHSFMLVIGIFLAGEPGHGLPLRLIDRGSDARTLAKEASYPMEGGMGQESPVVGWIADAGSGYDIAK